MRGTSGGTTASSGLVSPARAGKSSAVRADDVVQIADAFRANYGLARCDHARNFIVGLVAEGADQRDAVGGSGGRIGAADIRRTRLLGVHQPDLDHVPGR